MKCLLIFILIFSKVDALTLSEIIEIGLSNHPRTRATWWHAKRSEAVVGSVTSDCYPDIFLHTSAIHGRDFKYINGPDTSYTIFRADLILSMLLCDFGARSADIQSAKMGLIAAHWNSNFALQQVLVEILENGYCLAHEQESLAASELSLKDAEKMVEVAEKLYHAGLKSTSDIYISKSARSSSQIQRAKKQSLYKIQKAKLASALSLPIDTDFTLAPIPLPEAQEKQYLQQLLQIANQQRSDLIEKRALAAKSKADWDRTQADYKPRLSFAARGGYDKAIKDKANGGHYEVVLNFDVPLFNGFKTFYQNQTAYSEMCERMEETKELELKIALDVLTFSSSLEAATQMLSFAHENLHNGEKAYAGTLNKYQVGEEGISELIMAHRQLAEARLLYSDVKTELLVSMANLAFATGTLCIQ